MEKIILDAEDAVVGRLASYAAKQALLGNEVAVVNCEKAIISGRKVDIIEDYKERRALNLIKPGKGPFFSKSAEKLVKKIIRGMLPDFRKGRGKVAWRKVRCYIGVPEELKKEKPTKLEHKIPQKNIKINELVEKI